MRRRIRPLIPTLVLLALPAWAIVIDNDVAQDVEGHWSVDVDSGGQTTTDDEQGQGAALTARLQSGELILDPGIVFDYESYVDPGIDGGGFVLSGTPPEVDPANPDRVTSSGTFTGATGNVIRWETASSIADQSTVMVNVVRFTAETGVLGALRFLQYLDEDVFADPSNDVFFPLGAAADGDLRLFTMDNVEVYGLSHSGALAPTFGLVNAHFAGWAADVYDAIAPRIVAPEGGQPVGPDGVVGENLTTTEHPTLGTVHGPNDIVSVLAWDVDPSATRAVIVTTLGGVPTGGTLCGDGQLDTEAGEACDLGAANGLPGSCCTSGCELRAAGESCRPAADACDAEEQCNGTTAECPADGVQLGTVVCRPAAGACDVAETCTGNDVACPPDALQPATATCRAPDGACDVAEHCSGTDAQCPANEFASAKTTCRAATGGCDAEERCTGAAADCPPDAVQPSTVVCRPAAGACDVAETCTGSDAACPPDAVQPATVTCRAPAGVCDIAERCTGADAQCPPNGFAPPTASCRPASAACDAEERCTGAAAECPPDAVAAAGTACRPVAGDCDIAETCNGSDLACPPDAVLPATVTCRAQDGVCDVAEHCSGADARCPANGFAPATTTCRPAAGVCDAEDRCTGTAPNCPADAVAAAGTACRVAADACDQTEVCDGVATTCAPDAVTPDGEACDDGDPATGTSVCVARACQGVAATVNVPAEIPVAATTPAAKVKVRVQVVVPDVAGSQQARVTLQGVVDCLELTPPLPSECGAGTTTTNGVITRIGSVFLPVTKKVTRKLGRTQSRSVSVSLPLTKLGRRLFAPLRSGEQSRTLPLRVRSTITDRQGKSIEAVLRSLLTRRR